MGRGDLIFSRLAAEYEQQRKRFLPQVDPGNPTWATCTLPVKELEGWKLHIPATILNAAEVLAKIGPILGEQRQSFKGIGDLLTLKKLNIGLFGLSQIGKAFTVYPHSDASAMEIADKLCKALDGMGAPSVPGERSVYSEGRVFYRYGAFHGRYITGPRGGKRLDIRAPSHASPPWVFNPFKLTQTTAETLPKTLRQLQSLTVLECLSQRGKGGVYRVVTKDGERAILKEGRRHGETSPTGTDGKIWIRRELTLLRDHEVFRHIGGPRILASFGDRKVSYGLLEDLGPDDLASLLLEGSLLADRARRYCQDLISILTTLHLSGWAWRDLKPANLIISESKTLRPIDFEGSCRIGQRGTEIWGSPGFIPPSWTKLGSQQDRQDCYALAVTMMAILAPSTLHILARDPDYRMLGTRARNLNRYSPYEISRELCQCLSDLIVFYPTSCVASLQVLSREVDRLLL